MLGKTKITQNSSWVNWGTNGFIYGSLLIIIGIMTQVFEIPRVYNGASNANIETNRTDSIYLISNYYNHWWPWTYAANFFGLFTLITGIAGLLAAVRRNYTSILIFFTMCFVSAVSAIYLIVYFAFIISFYRSNGKDTSSNRTSSESVSYGLACTQLVVAIINIVISTISAIIAGRAIALCVSKGVEDEDIIPPPLTPRPRPVYRTEPKHA